ncbi:MAG: DinB family protein [Desulfobulbaceae bacterium]|nr:DinB family protein [Desulfobulbaceae bacterium]
MSIAQSLLPEFDIEMANTRKILEIVPEAKFSWRAHPKSYTIQEIATHIANLPTWTGYTITQDSLDLAPVDGKPLPPTPLANSTQELVETFDKNVATARGFLANASDEQLMKNWSLLIAGQVLFTMPKVAVLRSFVMSHMIHHRAQLGVYLRINDVALPGIYGPSSDEKNIHG